MNKTENATISRGRLERLVRPLALGIKTELGEIVAVHKHGDGERYYMMIDKHKVVSLVPAAVMERPNATR